MRYTVGEKIYLDVKTFGPFPADVVDLPGNSVPTAFEVVEVGESKLIVRPKS